MTEEPDTKDTPSDLGSKTFINKSKDKKIRSQKPLTKIILRRLPPTMTEESFLEQVSPIPEHDHLSFAKPDLSLGNNVYSRAYINFVNVEDIYLFRDKFDGYVFLDEKGVEYVGIVEYAPFQRIPKKKKKKDPKCGTIESDPVYQEFVESLKKDLEVENQPKLEYSYPINDGNDKKAQSTPLLEYLAARKQDKRGRDERRRRENDKRKMRIERKIKDSSIKNEDISEDEALNDNHISSNHKSKENKTWRGEQRIYHKSKVRYSLGKYEAKNVHCSDEQISTDSDWDSHFPALSTKMHSTFTLSSKCSKKGMQEASQKSGGDSVFKEDEVGENEVKKIKPREWEKDKQTSKNKDDHVDSKDCMVFESKSYKDRKSAANTVDKKKRYESDKNDDTENGDKTFKRDSKIKDSPRDQKSKKYSDSRKERTSKDSIKSEKPSFSKMEVKSKLPNHDDIKPFTQLPQVKTDDLTKIIEGMDRKAKEEKEEKREGLRLRRISLESGEAEAAAARGDDDEVALQRQNSLDDRSKSTDREDSEQEKSESTDRHTQRRIRNKDRPSLVIYQPGMGKFSKQRLSKDTPTKTVNDSEKKDT